MTELTDPRRGRDNALLARLPTDEYKRLLDLAQLVEVKRRDLVHERNHPISHVYFPLDAVFSLIAISDNRTVEVNTVGKEGMVGLPSFLGAATHPNRAYCQVPGQALRLNVPALRAMLAEGGTLHQVLQIYAQVTIVQLSQNVACNRLHDAEQRCSRWLLLTHDRMGRHDFSLTQGFLAQMLGVRRATVSEVIGRLQARGLIGTTRGYVTIRDRPGLERLACECYWIIRRESARLLDQ